MRTTGHGKAFLLGLLLVAAPIAGSAAGEPSAVVQVVVHVDDRVRVPSGELETARNEIENVVLADILRRHP